MKVSRSRTSKPPWSTSKLAAPTYFSPPFRIRSKALRIYNEVGDKLVRIGEWRTSTDRDVRIKGRHSRRFYQFADDLLRSSMERDASRIAAARAALEASFAEVDA